jgi:hypothetical protein|tara:strand:+ start:1178 stop:2470 length:1293 start_codon:yes stop_codon:yes gene_type:complete
MFRFGYDFVSDKKEILHTNGIINYKSAEFNVFNLYSPPWWGELLNKNNFNWSVDSVKNIIKKDYDSKWIYMIEPRGDSRGWLGQYRDENPNVIKSLTAGMSKESLSSVRDNKAIICLYQAGEAAPVNHVNINLFEEFYKELLKHKIDPSNFVFITGNMIAKEQFSKWKPNSEYKNEKDFSIIEFSGYRHIDYKQKWALAKKDLNKNIEKHFLCYNRAMVHPHRLLLLALLEKENLIDKGLVSYPKFSKKHFREKLISFFNIGTRLQNKLLLSVDKLKERAPSIIDVDEWNTNHFDTSPPWPYEKTFFSLVSESQFVQDTLFLSEKIWKSIANKHPFVLVGSYKTLDYLHKEGFKTFHPLIDESYDKEKHLYKRIIKIIKEVKKLCSMNQLEINKFLSDIDGIVEHNYDRLINDHYNIDRTFKELEAITNE